MLREAAGRRVEQCWRHRRPYRNGRHQRRRAEARDGGKRVRVPAQGSPPKPHGNSEEAMRNAPVKVEAEYRIPIDVVEQGGDTLRSGHGLLRAQ